jgi:hypothetical protein
MRKFPKVIAVLLLIVSTGPVFATEEAKYDLVMGDGDFQLRDYAEQVVAEVVIGDDFEKAGSRAFRMLFKYISGDNETSQDIAMTAPVAQARPGDKISMTAPVGQLSTADGWAVSFVLPANYSIDSAPVPTNPEVQLRAIPERRMATIRYSGRWTEKNYVKYLERLNRWIESEGLQAAGDPVWARYNPPFTPPFWRRNEIMIPVEH